MELKLIENDICQSEERFNQTIEQSVDTNINLPDYCENAASILCCRFVPYINNKNINGQSVVIDGSVDINVLYLNEDNKIRSVNSIYNFSKTVDAGSDISNCCCYVNAKTEYTNCRTVNNRKIDIHGSVSLNVKIICNNQVKVLSAIENQDVQQKSRQILTTTMCGFAAKNLVIDEEIFLPSGRRAVEGVLDKSLTACFTDCKIIGNKAVVKGEAEFEVLYYDETGKISKFNQTLPQSMILEDAGFTDDCACSVTAQVCGIELRLINDAPNESGFYVNARINVEVSAQKTAEIPVLLDAYSTKYETVLEKSNLTTSWSSRSVFERFSCRKSIEIPGGTVSAVLNLSCNAFVTDTSAQEERININGIANMSLLYLDDQNAVHCIEKPVEFKYSLEKENPAENTVSNVSVQTSSLNYVITADNAVEAKVELCVCAHILASSTNNVVTAIQIDTDKEKQLSNKGTLVVYYATANESVWDIARKYNTSQNRVMTLNSLEEDVLPSDKTLLIPCN